MKTIRTASPEILVPQEAPMEELSAVELEMVGGGAVMTNDD